MTARLVLDRQALRVARLTAGLSQLTLAERAGLHPITVTRYETGALTPRPDNVRRLAEALGVEVLALAKVEQ